MTSATRFEAALAESERAKHQGNRRALIMQVNLIVKIPQMRRPPDHYLTRLLTSTVQDRD